MNICRNVNRGWAEGDSFKYIGGAGSVSVGYAISPENASCVELGNGSFVNSDGGALTFLNCGIQTTSVDIVDKNADAKVKKLYFASAIGCVIIIIAGVVLFRGKGKK